LGDEDLDKVELGRRVREARNGAGFTQEALAEKADIGVMYLGEIERGIKMPSLKIFTKIVEALNVSADYLLRDEVSSGKSFVYDEITQKLEGLTPKQRKGAAEILDAYLRTL